MRQSVRLRARGIEVPRLDDEQLVLRGAACFRDKCQQCHGAPGVAQDDIGKSMQPLPGPLVDARHHWNARELYWVTKHGIKMSGMPAWEYRLAEEDLWAVVAFLAAPARSDGAAVCASRRGPRPPAARARRQRPARRAMRGAARGRCTSTPAMPATPFPASPAPQPHVGPPLDGIARRAMIGGRLANTPDNMVRWLRRTHEVDPRTAMPEMGLTEQDARDIAAYLSTLD